MTTIAKTLISSKYAESTQTTQYTSTSVKTIIDKFTATNVSGGPVVFSVNIVPVSDTVSSANKIVSGKTIQPNQSYTFPELVGHTLNDGDFISTISDTASALVIRSSGRQVS